MITRRYGRAARCSSGVDGTAILAGFLTNLYSYTPDCEDFRITSAGFDGGALTIGFPSISGRSYTLWQSEALTIGSWTNTGLPALTGTGATLTFTVSAPTAGVLKRFFRVQADP